MVEQFGLAIIPVWLNTSWLLTSGTISGIPSSILKALLLSITTAPLSTAYFANSFDLEAPAEKRAISIFLKESPVNSFTSISSFLNLTFLPTERDEASAVRFLIGKLISSRIDRKTCPTAPVAPAIATLYSFTLYTYAPFFIKSETTMQHFYCCF